MFNSKKFNQSPFNGVPGQQPIAPVVQLLEMLYLFNADETLVAVLPQDSFFTPRHYEGLNRSNTFTFSYPADREEAQYIIEGNLVGYKDLDVAWHIFEIKRIVDLHGDGLTRTAFCEHIYYELRDDLVTDQRPTGSAVSALSGALTGTRWQVGIVDDLGTASTNFYYESALSAVQKIAIAWKGELQWRCFMVGGTIVRYVDLLAMRGTDTGKQFVYSKDILEIEREVDATGVVTALYGRGKGVETDAGTGYGRRLTFADVVWITPTNPVNKPAGQEWVGDSGALAQFGRPGGRHRTGVFTNEDETDPALLLQETWDDLQARKTPRVTYRLKVAALETLTGYSHEAVRLGDLVRVIDREFKPELLVSARVVELTRDLQDPSNTEVVLGSFAPTIIETNINVERRVNDLANKPFNTAWLDGKISILQNEINNTQSFVFQTPGDGILIMDAATFALATKAMKIGGGIFALANTKTGDIWNWRTFGNGAGFTADEINAGLVKAQFVQLGAASTFATGYDPSGKFAQPGYVTADAEGIKSYDNLSALRVQMGSWVTDTLRKYGLKIIGGEIYASTIRTGAEGATTYIGLENNNQLVLMRNGALALMMQSTGADGRIYFYDAGTLYGEIYATYNSNTTNYFAVVPSATSGRALLLGNAAGTVVDGGLYAKGNISVQGNIDATGYIHAAGIKPAAQITENYGIRYLYAVESSEVLYCDRGVINLQNGECIIKFDPIFLECIEPDTPDTPWLIWCECYGENDVYVSEIGSNYFKIKERNSGQSDNKVVWKFEGNRAGYAGFRLMEEAFD